MKHEISLRITVKNPVPGVAIMMQKGRDELVPPVESSLDSAVFDFTVTADLAGDAPNFLGKFTQGPKDKRFVYINTGTYAGQHSCWARRAKISLMSITRGQVEKVAASQGGRLEAEIHGTGRDGGPSCASVPVIGGWRVIEAETGA